MASFGLRAALTSLVVIAIVPVFGVVVQSSLARQEDSLRRAEDRVRSLAAAAQLQLHGQVEGARRLLAAVAHAPPVQGTDIAACAAYLGKLQADFPAEWGSFGVLDAQGALTCRSSPSPSQVRSSDRGFFRAAVSGGRFSIGEYTVSRASGRKVLTFGQPVMRPDGSLRGVAYVALDLADVGEQLRRLGFVPEVTLVVADADGVVLAAAGGLPFEVGQVLPQAFLREAFARRSAGLGRTRDAGGQEWIHAVHEAGRPGERSLLVAAVASSQSVLAPLEAELQRQLGVLALITLLAAAAAWTFADAVVLRPMRQLLRDVDAVAQESQPLDRPVPPGRLREFQELHQHVHGMGRRLVERAVLRDAALAEMEHQKKMLESVFDTMAEGVVVIDPQGGFVQLNPAAIRMLPGLPALGRHPAPAMAPGDAWGLYALDGLTLLAPPQRPHDKALRGQPVDRFRVLARGPMAGGTDKVLQGSAQPLRLPGAGGGGAVLLFSDVSEAWRAEQALRASERRYRTLFEANPHPMWVVDRETLRFLTVNDAAVARYGYSAAEFATMTLDDIRPPEEVPKLHQVLADSEAGLGAPGTWRHRRKDGSILHVEVSAHAMVYDGHAASMVLAHDVTRRVEAEDALRQLNESLERRVQERTRELALAYDELESFSFSVSHDLRAPLQAIDGFGGALASRHAAELSPRAAHYLQRIRDNASRMQQLIDDLLALARVTRLELSAEHFDLAPRVWSVVEQLRQRAPQRQVDVRVQDAMPCGGDPRLLVILLENLVGNAWKFTGRTEDARIEVGCRLEGGEQVFHVADNGAGFDMEHAHRLFRPFQRLHTLAEFEGTGIGLATVHRIVARHGGRVWAQAAPGQGATFFFTLGPAPAPAA